jgi:hypothetical protein
LSSPRAVVIPFGVPAEGRGLGLGLAALLHTCLCLDGGEVAIAQLHARRDDAPDGAPPAPVEAFLPPAAWRDLAGRGDTPSGVALVVTGAFEPPLDGHGTLQLLAFDARDGKERARIDAPLEGARAGASLVGAFEQMGARLGSEIGALGRVGDLEWEALESVLRAERCVLHDPLRGGPHDRLAAMLHLGRAIGDAPAARYPAERLASIALEAAMASTLDPSLAAAAARALSRGVGGVKEEAGTRRRRTWGSSRLWRRSRCASARAWPPSDGSTRRSCWHRSASGSTCSWRRRCAHKGASTPRWRRSSPPRRGRGAIRGW